MQEFSFPLYSDFMDIADVPRYDFSTRQIIDQAPKTNVGIVSLPSGQYTFPRSDDARSLLNYGPTAGEDTSSFIRDSDGNFLGNKFPVTIGNDSAVTTSASTKAELRTGLLDKYITAMMGEDFPTSGAGKAKVAGGCAFGMQENSNAPDATNLFASDGAAAAIVPRASSRL